MAESKIKFAGASENPSATKAAGGGRHPSRRSQWGLDWLIFFLTDVQTGLGPFLAIYLADNHWNQQQVGLALTLGGVVGILTQIPAGELIDQLKCKRALVAIGVVTLSVGAIIIAQFSAPWPVDIAQVLIGGTASIFAPAFAAISLGLVGYGGLDRRQGRNQAFDSAGNVAAAIAMGLIAWKISNRAAFYFIAATGVPTLFALAMIRPLEIDHELARGGRDGKAEDKAIGLLELMHDKRLFIFALCSVTFHFANAAMLPALGEMLAQGKGNASMAFMGACVTTTQFVIAILAAFVGQGAHKWGRKPWLLIGFGVLPIRGVLYTMTHQPALLIAIQILDGIGAGIYGVVSVLVVADLTRGTGRFNVTLAAITAAVGIGAAISQTIAGSIIHHFSYNAGFLFLAGVAAVAFFILAKWMPETRDNEAVHS